MKMSRKELAEHYGVTVQTVTNWGNSEPPCPSEGSGHGRTFDTVLVAEWHAAKAAREAVAKFQKQPPTDEDDARRRKLVAEAVLAEMEVREKEGELIPRDIHEDVVGQMADRLRAKLINAPSNYGLALERAGISAEIAQEVLERLADDLTKALREVADDADEVELDDAA